MVRPWTLEEGSVSLENYTALDRTFEDYDELMEILLRHNKGVRPADFLWNRVSDAVHIRLLYAVAEELNLPNPRLIASKNLEKHRFRFLQGASLNGLYSYYKNRMSRRPGMHILTNVCNKLGIPQVSLQEWLVYIGSHNIFSWKNIPAFVQKEILLSAAHELGYTHPIFMTNEDFSRKFKRIHHKSLTGLYTYYRNQFDGVRGSILKSMCECLDIPIRDEDWIVYATGGQVNIFWEIVPKEILRRLLFTAARYQGYSNPRMMSVDDLKTKIPALNGFSLYSFASRYFGRNRQGSSSVEYICDLYEVPPLTFEDWIFRISYQKNFKWELLPPDYLGQLLRIKAEEAQKPNPRMLKYEDLAAPFLAIQGKNLISLYTVYRSISKDKKADTIQTMCDLGSLPPLTAQQWFHLLREPDTKASWEHVPDSVKRDLLQRAAEEAGVKNPRLLGYKDLCMHRFHFLGGKTLSGFYAHYAAKLESAKAPLMQGVCDALGIERPTSADWIMLIAESGSCRWESIPLRVQRELVLRAAQELKLQHPRLMGAREFDGTEYAFLKGKTLSGLYYHHAAKMPDRRMPIHGYIFSVLNIPKMDIHPKTGRLNTLDNTDHCKYFDSLANVKEFVNAYLALFPLETLVRKYTAISNAKKAGIYKKGLVTILAPLSRPAYMDFLYEILKNVPRDLLNLRKPRGGSYKLEKSDLYQLAGLTDRPAPPCRIDFADTARAPIQDIAAVLQDIAVYRDLLKLKIRKFNEVQCTYLISHEGASIFQSPVSFYPGDILTADSGLEFEVSECREKKANDGYILELKALQDVSDPEIEGIRSFAKDSNDSILADYLTELMQDAALNRLSPLLAVTLGLKRARLMSFQDISPLPQEAFSNPVLLKNTAQRQAVDLALSLDDAENPIAIIQGPPGTGKTTLIQEIALQVYRQGKNVLILAKTNVAVDNIVEKLFENEIRLLRTGNNIERKSNLPYAPSISTANPQYMRMLQGMNVVALGTPLGFYLDRNKEALSYDLVIIDEASQMDIPESLFSLGMARKAVIIGDHLQIPPFPVQNEVLLEFDPAIDVETREALQRSLFERLITDRNRYNSVFLDINYRTENPRMVSFISDLVYDGRLCPDTDAPYYHLPDMKRRRLFPEQAIEILDTAEITDIQARLETEVNSTYYNLSEAMLSVKKVLDLMQAGESLQDICIITPYKAHAQKLKEVFLQHAKYFRRQDSLIGFIEHNIYTVDSFQGREQQNIIINWVRSNYGLPGTPTRTGFLRDYRRINVALSRAKKRLILIGDYETLTQSDNHKVRHIFTQIKGIPKAKKIVL